MLFKSSSELLLSRVSSTEEDLLKKLSNNGNTNNEMPINLDEDDETIEPFIFTTSLPSASPHPPGIALTVDKELQATTLENLMVDSKTTNLVKTTTTTIKDDFNLEDDEIIGNGKIKSTINPLLSNNQFSSSKDVDYKISEGVNSFDNSQISDQYILSVSEENYLPTTIASKLKDNDELDSLDEKENFSNNISPTTESSFIVTEDFLLTTETNQINITSIASEILSNNSDHFVVSENITSIIDNNYTNEMKNSCPEIEICNPGCAISIDSEGCQRCTCLWIPKFCIETSECNGPEYICEYGKCLCDTNYTQDMERSGICIPKPNNLKQNEV